MSTPHRFRPLPDAPIFVGFAGRIGSGKTSAASYLSVKYSFQYARYSQVLQVWLAADDAAREALQAVGWNVMNGGRQRTLNCRLIASLDRSRSAAIDGLRHSIDFESLSSRFGSAFGMVFVDAPDEVRYERLNRRFATPEAFQVADAHPVEGYIEGLRSLATLTLLNDNSLEDLHQKLDEWIIGRGIKGVR